MLNQMEIKAVRQAPELCYQGPYNCFNDLKNFYQQCGFELYRALELLVVKMYDYIREIDVLDHSQFTHFIENDHEMLILTHMPFKWMIH